MYLHVDAGQVPPAVELRDPDDFTSLKAVVVVPSHLWLGPAQLTALAGRGGDQAWQGQLAAMAAYAGKHGWLDSDGRIRMHTEVENS